ncbi:MAG: hypothetical protein JXR03_03670 [Cyclobacteriaceae bacterium]
MSLRFPSLLFLCTLFISGIPMSCDPYGCGGGSHTNFRIDSYSFYVGRDYKDLQGNDLFETNDTLSSNQFAIKIEADTLVRISSSKIKNQHFSIISSAYACSPLEPSVSNGITNLSIVASDSIWFDGVVFPPETELYQEILSEEGWYTVYDIGLYANMFSVINFNGRLDKSFTTSFKIKYDLSDWDGTGVVSSEITTDAVYVYP